MSHFSLLYNEYTTHKNWMSKVVPCNEHMALRVVNMNNDVTALLDGLRNNGPKVVRYAASEVLHSLVSKTEVDCARRLCYVHGYGRAGALHVSETAL